MDYKVKIHIDNESKHGFTINTNSRTLEKMKGLPSGRRVMLNVNGDSIGVRPYYRRFIDGTLNIYAINLYLNNR